MGLGSSPGARFDAGGTGGPSPPGTVAVAAMPLPVPEGPQGGPSWPAQTVATARDILNGSNVLGGSGSLVDALNYLLSASGTPLQSALLADANATVATSQRYVLPANTLTAARTLILTPGANGLAYICEIGTQAFNYTINQNGAAGGTLYTVLAGTRFAMWVGSDGTDLVFPREAPLGAEPLL